VPTELTKYKKRKGKKQSFKIKAPEKKQNTSKLVVGKSPTSNRKKKRGIKKKKKKTSKEHGR